MKWLCGLNLKLTLSTQLKVWFRGGYDPVGEKTWLVEMSQCVQIFEDYTLAPLLSSIFCLPTTV